MPNNVEEFGEFGRQVVHLDLSAADFRECRLGRILHLQNNKGVALGERVLVDEVLTLDKNTHC